jgi:hypothetical protein
MLQDKQFTNDRDVVEDRGFMAKLAGSTLCVDDMVEFVTEMVDANQAELTADQRNLVSMAFRKSIENDRKALSTLHDIQDFEHISKF